MPQASTPIQLGFKDIVIKELTSSGTGISDGFSLNDFGDTVTFSRTGTGTYDFVFADANILNHSLSLTNVTNGDYLKTVDFGILNETTFRIATYNNGVLSDNVLNNANVTIRIYN